jgi:2-haloalkanoic acid dehalogenase type II
VREAALAAGIPAERAGTLTRRWVELEPWPETRRLVAALAARVPLAIATNCSDALGRLAASRAGGPFRAVITAETAGWYKPRPEPYRAALAALGTEPQRTLFVAGSAADVPGARAAGMPVYWHNRMGLTPLDDARPDFAEDSLEPLLRLV